MQDFSHQVAINSTYASKELKNYIINAYIQKIERRAFTGIWNIATFIQSANYVDYYSDYMATFDLVKKFNLQLKTKNEDINADGDIKTTLSVFGTRFTEDASGEEEFDLASGEVNSINDYLPIIIDSVLQWDGEDILYLTNTEYRKFIKKDVEYTDTSIEVVFCEMHEHVLAYFITKLYFGDKYFPFHGDNLNENTLAATLNLLYTSKDCKITSERLYYLAAQRDITVHYTDDRGAKLCIITGGKFRSPNRVTDVRSIDKEFIKIILMNSPYYNEDTNCFTINRYIFNALDK